VARFARGLWALHDLLQPARSLADGWCLGLDQEALAETHDGSVQMIDTSIVRVHQHGGCAGGGETRLMGRSRGGLTTKIHACVDTNGLPVRLELTTGEAHDNRLVILSPLAAIAPFLFGAVAVSLAVAAICKCAYGRISLRRNLARGIRTSSPDAAGTLSVNYVASSPPKKIWLTTLDSPKRKRPNIIAGWIQSSLRQLPEVN
jgi:hypothetical protein